MKKIMKEVKSKSKIKLFDVTIRRIVTRTRQVHWWSSKQKDVVQTDDIIKQIRAYSQSDAEAFAENFIKLSAALNLNCVINNIGSVASVKFDVISIVESKKSGNTTSIKKETKKTK